MAIESRVGNKGELFLPKALREKLGLRPGDRIYFEVKGRTLLVRKVTDLLDLLAMPPLNAPQSPEEIEKELEEFQNQARKLSDEDI